MKQRTIVALFGTLALLMGSATASAAFITGDITFSGDFAPTGGGGLGDATGLDFLGDDFTVDDVTGDFASTINSGDVGSLADFQFSPVLFPSPVDPLWSVGGFEFVLSDVTVVFQSNAFLVLEGTGTLSAAGFDNTGGTWNLTGNSAGTLFNFSAGSTAEGIPAPATLLLVGLGLAGIAVARRRRS